MHPSPFTKAGFWAVLCLVIFAQLNANSAAQGRPEELWLTIRVLPDASAETLQYLASVSRPTKIVAPAGLTLKSTIRRHYGYASMPLQNLVRRYNGMPDLDAVLDQPADINLPAAPLWHFNVKKTIPWNASATSIAYNEVGVAGAKTVNAIRDENPHVFTTRAARQGNVEVTLPFDTRFRSFQLTTSSPEEASAIIARLKKDPAVVLASVSTRPQLIRQWTLADVNGISATCAEPSPSASWPYSLLPKTVPGKRVNKTVVAVIDSGIAENDPRFPLWTNLEEVNAAALSDADGNHCLDDVVGCNMVTRNGFPVDDLQVAGLTNHGTHVAGIISGRLAPPSLKTELDERIELMILKVADETGVVYPDAVANAVLYAANKGANIINLSIAGTYAEVIEEVIRRSSNVLFILAAGNEPSGQGNDLNTPPSSYPAALAAKYSNVIAVAAHDAGAGLACFSNYGSQIVDLAAPGVDVESTIKGGTSRLSGTSQAAPFVTLTAAILFSQGVTSPTAIKSRILSTVAPVKTRDRGKLRTAGALNVVAAINVDDDVIELRDSTILAGRIMNPEKIRLPDATEVCMDSIRALQMADPSLDMEQQRVTVTRLGNLAYFTGTFWNGTLHLRTSGQIQPLPAATIRRIVPSLRRAAGAPRCERT